MAVSFDEIGAVDARGVAEATIKWYYDNGKVEKEGDEYTCSCMVCRQKFHNADPSAIVAIAEACRVSHVHDKGVTF